MSRFFAYYHVDGAFVLYNYRSDSIMVFNREKSNKGYTPAHTFDILLALAGLEANVVRHKDFIIPFPGNRTYIIDEWNKNHTLETAFKQNVVWYFQELARELKPKHIQRFVDKCNYGNRDISSSKSPFWLSGRLRITPVQQVRFLVQLVKETIPFSQFSIQTVKRIMFWEKTDRYTMWGKTGRSYQDGIGIGWFVGYLQKGVNIYVFATLIEAKNPDSKFGKTRITLTRRILDHLILL